MESRELPKETMGIGIFVGDLCDCVEERKAGERRVRDRDGGMQTERHPWKNGWSSLWGVRLCGLLLVAATSGKINHSCTNFYHWRVWLWLSRGLGILQRLNYGGDLASVGTSFFRWLQSSLKFLFILNLLILQILLCTIQVFHAFQFPHSWKWGGWGGKMPL